MKLRHGLLIRGLLAGFALSLASLVSAENDSIWIDVRTPQEYGTGHLEQATNIPHTEIADKIAQLTTDKSAEIKLYCRSGGRADMAKKTLEEMGYTNVTNYGGYEDAKKVVEKN